MGTRYTDELAAWADQKAEKKRRQDAAAVAFLAVRGDVVEAMEAAGLVGPLNSNGSREVYAPPPPEAD